MKHLKPVPLYIVRRGDKIYFLNFQLWQRVNRVKKLDHISVYVDMVNEVYEIKLRG
jgi:hypothetical protein